MKGDRPVTILSTFLELAGVVLVAAGAYTLAPWLGLIVAGVLVVTVGVALDPPRQKGDR